MSKNSQFEKFINKTRGSAIKEQIKQEKKAIKKERAQAIEKRFQEKRKIKAGGKNPEVSGREPGAGHQHKKIPKGETVIVTNEDDKKPQRGAKIVARNKDDKKPQRGDTTRRGNQSVQMPLNKYIAHSGLSGRREAAELVRSGEVTVNGEIITEPGTKIADTDIVKIKGRKITPSKNFVYILLNKPKDYITTTDDPYQRKTVLDLIRNATDERVYPIGRLDRNTSGVLLFTNDGELAQNLSHPKNEIKKIYEVKLDKDLTKNDFEQLLKGLTLEDGFIAPDALAYADAKDKSVIGIEIHSGRNRIVRRIFEKLGYDVRGLDRVMYAGLTKKNVQRGKWRFLSEREIRILKHFNKAAHKA
ncbi:MAG: pseudouridine synthase [Chitinophagaceae bacterium]